MMVVYVLITVFILAGLCALTPFFAEWNKKIPTKEEEEAQKLLSSAPSRVKRACKYRCLQCGNKLLPDQDGMNVRCYKCDNLWHPDYILTVYENEDLK
jgi:NADH pyrophosphatase NudC (nudix superfamily)